MTDVDGGDMRFGGADWETLVYRYALVVGSCTLFHWSIGKLLK